ncbi:MAG: ABC transporter permease [Actinomycetota bacterium]
MTLAAYVRHRLLLMLPIALGITLVTFLLIHLIPGDPAITMLGFRANAARIAALHRTWGLDKPLYVQYWLFLGRLARANFGISLFYNSSATGVIVSAASVTLWLVTYAGLLSVAMAVPLAILAATHRDGVIDQAVRAIPLVGLGMPAAWVGIMLILLLSLKIHLFPVGGYGQGIGGHLYSLFLPALTLALPTAPIIVRSLRASLIDALDSDYVSTARSKGISERRVMLRHAVRNAITTSVTILGLEIAWLVSGTIVVEKVFALPGVGALMVDSIYRRDFPVVQGITFILAIAVILTNLGTDVVHALLDPRVRFE